MPLLYPTIRNARENPRGLALLTPGRSLDHETLEALSARTARSLRARGVGAGDRVAVLAPNRVEWAFVVHAAPRLKAVLAPLHARLAAPEIRDRTARLRPRIVVVSEETEAVARALEADGHPCVTMAALREEEPGAAGPLEDAVEAEAAHTVLFTSGTAGRPKGVVLTLANHLASARAFARPLGAGATDRWLLCLPLAHIGGLAILLRAAFLGFTVVLHERFDPRDLWRSLRDDGVTIVSLVPEMLERVLAADPEARAPGSLRVVLLGGGPAPGALLREARRRGFRLATTYGLTEASSQVTTLPWNEAGEEIEGCGPPLPGTEVRLRREDGAAAAAGEDGEILVRGPTVMREYLDDAAATEAAFENGWLRTGDIGRWSPRGDLIVVARRSDLFVSGGENVSPAEIEAALREHPAVAASVVAGVPDARWGRVPAALVARRAGAAVRVEELEAFVAERLARFKVPRRIVLVERLPETASGKPDRTAAAAILEAAGGESEGR